MCRTNHLFKAVPMDYMGLFDSSPRWCTLVLFLHGPEVCDEHKASVSKPDDVVRKKVSDSETRVLQSCELVAFSDQSTKEVARQLQCLILNHKEHLVFGQAHLVNGRSIVEVVLLLIRGW